MAKAPTNVEDKVVKVSKPKFTVERILKMFTTGFFTLGMFKPWLDTLGMLFLIEEFWVVPKAFMVAMIEVTPKTTRVYLIYY
ncbi:hypothetical protein GOBAR_DD10143 [Gossypium barbadense]|nr:hypothetical protein GOBAR_DD10143 [Gossypium barbadense]